MPNYLKMPKKSQVLAFLDLGLIYRCIEAETKGKQGRPLSACQHGSPCMLFRATYARHRIRHGMRHTAALSGRRPRPPVANDRLRHRRIGSARVSTAAGSQSLAVPCDALQAAATRDLSSPSGFPPVRQCPSIWRETACGRLRTLPY